MTDQTFIVGLTADQLQYWSNAKGQRDDAIARITAYDANAATLAAQNAAALKAAQDKGASDLVAAQQQAANTLSATEASAASALAAANAKAVADLTAANEKAVSDLAAAEAKAVTDQAAAVKAATDPLNAEIVTLNATVATLQAQVTALQTQLAGVAGSFQLTFTAAEMAALQIEAAARNTTVQALILSLSPGPAIASAHKTTILDAALQKWPTLTDAQRLQILTLMDRAYLAPLTVPQQIAVLTSTALDDFNNAPLDHQNTIINALGIA